MEQPKYSQEEIQTAINIFEKAIEYFKIPNEPSNEEAKTYMTDEGLIDFTKIPLVTIKVWEGGQKFINLLYFDVGFLLVYADYNPVPAILSFIEEARKFLEKRFPNTEKNKLEEWVEIDATKMTFALISRLHTRMYLAMQNFTDEVIHNWIIEWVKWEKKTCKEQGIESPRYAIGEKAFFRNLLKRYEDDVVNLWFDNPNPNFEDQKIKLAKEYPSLLNHWKKLRKEYRDDNPDWLEYAKAGKFFDTPDDLITLFEDCSNMSHLALEQAGRRVGLVNPKMKGVNLEKRKNGINVTGYTARQLSTFKSEGEKLLNEVKK